MEIIVSVRQAYCKLVMRYFELSAWSIANANLKYNILYHGTSHCTEAINCGRSEVKVQSSMSLAKRSGPIPVSRPENDLIGLIANRG